MLVEEIMKRDIVTLRPNSTIVEALKYVQEKQIHHFPVIDKNKHVVGIVSDRDIRDASPSIFDKNPSYDNLNKSISTIMTKSVVTVHPLDFVEEIARIFYNKRFSSLPVVENNQFVGLITDNDMLSTLITLTGTHVQSSHIEVKVPHKPGVLPEVANVFGRRKINIVSVLVYPYKNDPNYKILVFRLQTMNPMPTIQDLRDAGYELMWPNNIQGPKQ